MKCFITFINLNLRSYDVHDELLDLRQLFLLTIPLTLTIPRCSRYNYLYENSVYKHNESKHRMKSGKALIKMIKMQVKKEAHMGLVKKSQNRNETKWIL